MRHLIEAAAADAEALSLVMHFAEKYLYEQGSPMLCGLEYFIEFLEAYIDSPRPDEYEKIRPAYLLENARKNRPGMTAADFGYEGRDGRQTRLHDTPGQRLLLLFYDPDCVHCRQTVALLQADARLRYLVDSGRADRAGRIQRRRPRAVGSARPAISRPTGSTPSKRAR